MYVLDEKLGRRRFLRGLGLSAAAAAAAPAVKAGPTFGSKQHALPVLNEGLAKQWNREAGEWIPSCCNMCGGQSGILVHVVNGVAEKIEPNHWNPNNYSNISTDFVPQVFLRRQRLMSQPWQPSGTVQRDLGARKFEQ